jgi:hypothetical protein
LGAALKLGRWGGTQKALRSRPKLYAKCNSLAVLDSLDLTDVIISIGKNIAVVFFFLIVSNTNAFTLPSKRVMLL